jgi:thiol-activated cytolysin
MKNTIIKPSVKYLAIIGILIFAHSSCQNNDPEPDNNLPSQEEVVAFNHDVDELSEFEQPAELVEPEVLSQADAARDTDDESLECYTTYYKAAPGFDELLALDPTSDVIYPGALVKGESIPTGEYLPIIANRDSITLSISLQNIAGSPVARIKDPKLSAVREGIKKILDQEVTGATPAKIDYEISQVYSREHLNLALGVNYRSAGTKVSSDFNFESTSYKYKYVLKFLQVYYTIDMDLPSDPSELFKELPDLNALGSTSPVYVSTVTYGRMILYTIESNYSKTEIDAAFSASFASGGGTIDAKYEKVISESSIKALVIGGSGDTASKTVNGPLQVYEYISTGGNYSKDSPGAPLSYKLRFIKNNAVARVVLSTEYFIRTCDLAYPVYSIELQSIACVSCQDGDGSPGEVYGRIWGYVRIDGKETGDRVDWNKNRSHYVSIGKGKSATIGITKITELYRPNYDVDNVLMGGKMYESDAGGTPFGDTDPDDNFGEINPGNVVYLKDIPYGGMSYALDFGEVKANFFLKRLK